MVVGIEGAERLVVASRGLFGDTKRVGRRAVVMLDEVLLDFGNAYGRNDDAL